MRRSIVRTLALVAAVVLYIGVAWMPAMAATTELIPIPKGGLHEVASVSPQSIDLSGSTSHLQFLDFTYLAPDKNERLMCRLQGTLRLSGAARRALLSSKRQVTLSTQVHGLACVQVILFARDGKIYVDDLSLVTGHRARVIDNELDIDVLNFAQNAVYPAKLVFSIDSEGSPVGVNFDVQSGTGLSTAAASDQELTLLVAGVKTNNLLSRRELYADLRRSGSWPVSAVDIHATLRNLRTQATVELSARVSTDQRSIRLPLPDALPAGDYEVNAKALGAFNEPEAAAVVTVRRADTLLLFTAIACALAGGGLVIRAILARRKRAENSRGTYSAGAAGSIMPAGDFGLVALLLALGLWSLIAFSFVSADAKSTIGHVIDPRGQMRAELGEFPAGSVVWAIRRVAGEDFEKGKRPCLYRLDGLTQKASSGSYIVLLASDAEACPSRQVTIS